MAEGVARPNPSVATGSAHVRSDRKHGAGERIEGARIPSVRDHAALKAADTKATGRRVQRLDSALASAARGELAKGLEDYREALSERYGPQTPMSTADLATLLTSLCGNFRVFATKESGRLAFGEFAQALASNYCANGKPVDTLRDALDCIPLTTPADCCAGVDAKRKPSSWIDEASPVRMLDEMRMRQDATYLATLAVASRTLPGLAAADRAKLVFDRVFRADALYSTARWHMALTEAGLAALAGALDVPARERHLAFVNRMGADGPIMPARALAAITRGYLRATKAADDERRLLGPALGLMLSSLHNQGASPEHLGFAVLGIALEVAATSDGLTRTALLDAMCAASEFCDADGRNAMGLACAAAGCDGRDVIGWQSGKGQESPAVQLRVAQVVRAVTWGLDVKAAPLTALFAHADDVEPGLEASEYAFKLLAYDMDGGFKAREFVKGLLRDLERSALPMHARADMIAHLMHLPHTASDRLKAEFNRVIAGLGEGPTALRIDPQLPSSVPAAQQGPYVRETKRSMTLTPSLGDIVEREVDDASAGVMPQQQPAAQTQVASNVSVSKANEGELAKSEVVVTAGSVAPVVWPNASVQVSADRAESGRGKVKQAWS